MNIDQWIIEADISAMQQALESGSITSEQLTKVYIQRIHRLNPQLRVVLEINPDALEIAIALDEERKQQGVRGLLHGIPILLKDNIDTADKMHTSAGAIALENSIAMTDSAVAANLRAAGAILLGKANMTEWASFMSPKMWAGYSSRGGLTLNPYGPGELFVGGSSSGSAVAVATNLAAPAIGTETSGSIISPASQNSVVGLKPTVGLVSQQGIIPITFTQDTAGPMGRTVTDVAFVLGGLVEKDGQSSTANTAEIRAYEDYTPFLDISFLQQARIGIPRTYMNELDEARLHIFEAAITVLKEAGATIVDPVHLPCEQAQWNADVLRYEFKYALNAYLEKLREDVPVHSLQDVIAFNEQYGERALKYGQNTLYWSEETSGTLQEKEYLDSLKYNAEMARTKGIDYALQEHHLDALMFLGDMGSDLAARAGYPMITVPGGYADTGVVAPGGYVTKGPHGISFIGTAWSEPTLIKIAFVFEQMTKHRVMLELDEF
ncbi:amidase family protein [Paenibacillus kandeliae]|uniref:amidase family protein n=1 Tax=Paenibacillus kandeliae TaxID=3231269 RepID=UPI0034594771